MDVPGRPRGDALEHALQLVTVATAGVATEKVVEQAWPWAAYGARYGSTSSRLVTTARPDPWPRPACSRGRGWRLEAARDQHRGDFGLIGVEVDHEVRASGGIVILLAAGALVASGSRPILEEGEQATTSVRHGAGAWVLALHMCDGLTLGLSRAQPPSRAPSRRSPTRTPYPSRARPKRIRALPS